MHNKIKKKRLTFVDIDFHKKTKSGNFLYEIFSKKFYTNLLWVKSKNKKFIFDPVSKNLKENIFFFQYLPDLISLFKLRHKKIFWAPMYDDIKKKNYFFWSLLSFFNIKIVSFSRKVNQICNKHKLNFIYIKYFPNFKKLKNKKIKNKFSIFFWYRGSVKIFDWINCINKKQVKEINYFNLKDPNFLNEKITNDMKKDYRIKFFQGHFGKKDHLYRKLVRKSDIYVAPREREGIGHSFLEAISLGKYIICKNEETMNEYITSKKIGIFFNQKLNIKDLINFSKVRENYMKKLSEDWNKNKIKLIKYILNS